MCRRIILAFSFAFLTFSLGSPFSARAQAARPALAKPVKEWSFLVFLNGKNNLDRFGTLNINQMEKVGSTDEVNILVQWGSLNNGTTRRLYVQKDNDTTRVTSPVVQDLGPNVDMGDWHTLVEFVRWAQANYPAKKYFIDMWDHGSGWHSVPGLLGRSSLGQAFHPTDISWDDRTGNFITTEQMGQAMAETASIIGHKVDVQGSDACLMAMPEVAREMSDSVQVFVGSEEVEPAAGWPYDQFLGRLAARPSMSAADAGTALTEEYVKSYSGGTNGTDEVTLSAFDLEKTPRLTQAVAALGAELKGLSTSELASVLNAVSRTQSYTYSDYADLGDFLVQLRTEKVHGISGDLLDSVKAALGEFVISTQSTPTFARSQGAAVWLPTSRWTADRHMTRYRGLQFHRDTLWGDSLQALVSAARN